MGWQRILQRGIAIAGGLALGLTVMMCDTERTASTVGEVAVGIGHIISDIGETGTSMLDHVDGSDAVAGPGEETVYHGECDKKWVVTETDKEGVVSTRTYWYSLVGVPGLDPSDVPFISALQCGPEWTGTTYTAEACPEDTEAYAHSCDGWYPPEMQCAPAIPRSLRDGELVVRCGFMNYDGNYGAVGHKYKNVHVRIRK